jgi:hypothetical protein
MGRHASRGNLGELLGRQAGLGSSRSRARAGTTVATGSGAAVAVEVATGRAWTTVATGSGAAVAVATEATTGGAGATVTVEATATRTGAAVAVAAEVAVRPIVSIARGRGKRDLGRGLALGGSATERGLGGGQNAGRLGAHAQDAPGARSEDLEVEIAEVYSELLTGHSDGLFDRLAGEFAVSVAIGSHVSVVSLAGWRADEYWAEQ